MAAPASVLSRWFLAKISCCVKQTLCNTSKCELQWQLVLEFWPTDLWEWDQWEPSVSVYGYWRMWIKFHSSPFGSFQQNISFWLFHTLIYKWTDIHIKSVRLPSCVWPLLFCGLTSLLDIKDSEHQEIFFLLVSLIFL